MFVWLVEPKYRKTFLVNETFRAFKRRVFDADSDIDKADTHPEYLRGGDIEQRANAWAQQNWATWVDSSPAFFTPAWRRTWPSPRLKAALAAAGLQVEAPAEEQEGGRRR